MDIVLEFTLKEPQVNINKILIVICPQKDQSINHVFIHLYNH